MVRKPFWMSSPLPPTYNSPSSPPGSVSRIYPVWIYFSPTPQQPLPLTWPTAKASNPVFLFVLIAISSHHARRTFEEYKLDHVIALNKTFHWFPVPIPSSWPTRPWAHLALTFSPGPCDAFADITLLAWPQALNLRTQLPSHFAWLTDPLLSGFLSNVIL